MIAKLTGKLDSVGEDWVIIDVGRRRLSGFLLGPDLESVTGKRRYC